MTATVKRGPEGNYVTQHELALAQDTPVSMETIEQLRHSLQERLSTWSSQPVSLFLLPFFTMANCFVLSSLTTPRAKKLGAIWKWLLPTWQRTFANSYV